MSKAIRIRTTPNDGDKYINIKLEQDFDFLEILSLNITQEDAYKKFSSDYGVIVGRVIINNGFGVPNAKVSVFIPLDDIDKFDTLKNGLYPFERINDKNSDGIRYNLLTQDSESKNECFTPIGTFPTKRTVLDNDVMLEIHRKYYKFTTTTNHAGDFMIFGVPLGNHTVHLDADISDMGIVSQRPYDMISKGADISRFDSATKFSSGTNLDKLVQVKSLDVGVNVQPFWGDKDTYEIGITRLDLDLNYDITPSAIFMGSIYGDKDKHSINKRCRPRAKLGVLDEQMTSNGTIRMIRKTVDNKTEEFNVDGSELIDEFGSWAYQVPMNLDYMVTDESGNLILSQDPNRGIPTRARVRFNIGMGNTGGEGRIRTRARYLVPNNPKLAADIDYEFGGKTKDHSFRDLHWNKIYTVSNYISRFQRNNSLTKDLTRASTGIKDVDNSGKTPFPYNKVNTETNPIFFIICLIMYIIILLISFMNSLIFPLINVLIDAWNSLMRPLCDASKKKILGVKIFGFLGFTCNLILKNIECISVFCPFDDGFSYAPGCDGGGRTFNSTNPRPTYYKNDSFGHTGPDVGLGDCIAFEMAKTLNLFQFDFYNDWVNGSLFSYLLKYKKRGNGSEKFCESNCDDIAGGGVDGNNNGVADNNCYPSVLLDTCYAIPNEKNCQKVTRKVSINEGLIKKVGPEFYYAATSKNSNFKLFATDIISLGSIFDCDWQGIPKIQKQLTSSSYKIPPDTQELTDDKLSVETSGIVDIGGNTCGNFFSIDCGGLHMNRRQATNIRHICEIGVDVDQAVLLENNIISAEADCIIGLSDIDNNFGKWTRDVFYGLNKTNTPWVGLNSLNIPSAGFSTDFNLNNSPDYNQVSTINNGADYIKFRNISFANTTAINDDTFGQSDHSYYFYFGLEPGNTGLDKMNQKFFTSCIKPIKNNILIESTSIQDQLNIGTGCTIFSFIGGIGPFTYTITGLNNPEGVPLNITPIVGTVATNVTATVCGLFAGTYLISAIDSFGTPVSDTVSINGPTPLYCYSYVSAMPTTDTSSDGSITIGNVGGGNGVLYYSLKKSNGTPVGLPALATTNLVLGGLSSDFIGYSLLIYDESVPPQQCLTTGLTVTGPSVITITYTGTNIHCYGESTGIINANILGGVPPYSTSINGPNGYSSVGIYNENLFSGQYTLTVVDGVGSAATQTVILVEENPQMIITQPTDGSVAKQCDINNYNIPIDITAGVTQGIVNIQYSLDDGTSWIDYPLPYSTTNRYVIVIPKANVNINNGVSVRFWIDNFPQQNVLPCYSEEIPYSVSEMEIPPVALSVKDGLGTNYTPALENIYHNLRQCNPNIATYTFSINQLDVNYTGRAPYTIDYHIESTTTTTMQTITHYNGLVTLTGLRNTNTLISPVDNAVDFYVRITDNKGCVFPATGWYNAKIRLPVAAMTKTIVTTPSGSNYSHALSVNGGIAPLTLSGYGVINAGQTYTFVNNSLVYVNTVTDANGCTIQIIG